MSKSGSASENMTRGRQWFRHRPSLSSSVNEAEVRISWAFAGSEPVFLHYILHDFGDARQVQAQADQEFGHGAIRSGNHTQA